MWAIWFKLAVTRHEPQAGRLRYTIAVVPAEIDRTNHFLYIQAPI